MQNFSPEVARIWAAFIRKIELYLEGRGLERVWTPTLVVNPGMEPELRPFKTEWQHGSRRTTFYLPTSPELHLKALLARGFSSIYEIKPCFRNDELTPIHEPEFYMLEWYHAGISIDDLIKETEGLIQLFKPDWRFTIKTMTELFHETLHFELKPDTTFMELKSLCQSANLETHPSDSWNDLFHRIFITLVEPKLAAHKALVVRDYPPSQAVLAKINARGFADRFELFIDGVEIANAFNELTDANENLERLELDLNVRKERGLEVLPLDYNFLRGLKEGLPESCGIALGLDRLFMSVYGFKSIQETRAFSVTDELRGFEP